MDFQARLQDEFHDCALKYPRAKLEHFFGYRSLPIKGDSEDNQSSRNDGEIGERDKAEFVEEVAFHSSQLRAWRYGNPEILTQCSRCACDGHSNEWFYYWAFQPIEKEADERIRNLAAHACEVFGGATNYSSLVDDRLPIDAPTPIQADDHQTADSTAHGAAKH